MKQLFFILLFFPFGKSFSQAIQLAPPHTPSTRLLLDGEMKIPFDFRMENAVIRYTTDGTEPTGNSPTYSTPLHLAEPKKVKAKAFHPDFLPSETVTVQAVAPGEVKIKYLGISPSPKKYVADGWQTLTDGVLGDGNFNENWLGFNEQEVILTCRLSKRKKLRQVNIGMLRKQGAWIFLPKEIEVRDAGGKFRTTVDYQPDVQQLDGMKMLTVDVPRLPCRELVITLRGLPELPDWHPGAGNLGWLFVDEILVR